MTPFSWNETIRLCSKSLPTLHFRCIENGAKQEATMKIALFALGVVVAASAMGTRAEAQNYPWCAYWHGTGGARNCGFVSFAQCQLTAQGAGADCRANTQYEPNKPMR
jgi:Protein of unknown function (DUF3551)